MKIVIKSAMILLACMLSILSCSKENGKAKTNQAATDSVSKISSATVVGRAVQRTIEATGTLAAWDEVTVSNETQGTVEEIFADMGDEVLEGKPLLRFNRQDARSDFNSADANLKKARAVLADADLNLKRYLNLFSEGIASTSQRDAAQIQYDIADAQLKQAEAQFEIAKKRLADTEIVSPISGHVKKRFVSTGEALKDKTPLFTLVKNNPLKFQGSVPETFASQIKAGQDVIVYIDAFPNETFSGEIIRVSPSIDEKTRTFPIEARVSNSGNILKSGFFAKAVIKMKQEKDIPFVPEAAVYSLAGINKIYVISNNIAVERLVKTGAHEAGMVEIIQGVKPGEVVAVTGLDRLFDGAKVEGK